MSCGISWSAQPPVGACESSHMMPHAKRSLPDAAAFKNDARMVQILLGASRARDDELLDATGRDGWTALGFAARIGNRPIVEALLKAGASAAVITGPSGKTALEIALANRRAAIAELLAPAA